MTHNSLDSIRTASEEKVSRFKSHWADLGSELDNIFLGTSTIGLYAAVCEQTNALLIQNVCLGNMLMQPKSVISSGTVNKTKHLMFYNRSVHYEDNYNQQY